jgi:F like protein
MTRRRHLAAVEALETEATAVVLGALGSVLNDVAAVFGSLTAAADPDRPVPPAAAGEALASLDDITRIQPEWTVKVDGTIVPYYDRVFEAGADGAVEQIAATRDVAVDVITEGDPLLVDQRKTQHLAAARDRFLKLGPDTWEATRAQLLEGFAAGEGIDPLRRRIESVVDVTRARAEALARTEVISASNGGAVARVDAMGADAPPYRQWMATNDTRTRPTHRQADGQVVPRGTPFDVGGHSLGYPGDPDGPAGEVINCRCTVLFLDTEQPEQLPPDLLAEIQDEMAADTATDADRQAVADWRINRHSRAPGQREAAMARLAVYAADLREGATSYAAVQLGPIQRDTITGALHDGSMIALVPTPEDTERLTIPDGEPPEALHLTLAYLGDAAAIAPADREQLRLDVEAAAAGMPPVVADPGAFGAALWNPDGDACLVYQVGGDGLTEARDVLTAPVLDAAFDPPPNHDPWVAHIAAAYLAGGADPAVALPLMLQQLGPVTFDRVRLTFGGTEVYDMPLGEPTMAAATPGDATMPYTVRPGGADCPFEVIKSADGTRMGCHPTKEEADQQVAALYAKEGEPPAADAAAAVAAPADAEGAPVGVDALPGEHFHAVMHTQGVSTGRRTFLNLSNRPTPFAFHWQRSSSAHGGMPEVLMVGQVTRVVPDPGNADMLHGFGRLDLGSDVAREYGRQLVGGFQTGVSIGLDETPVKRTVVWPEGIDPADPMAMMEAEPDQVIIDGGRIMELTGTSVPAQYDASIEPTDELRQAMVTDAVPLTAATRLTDRGTVARGPQPLPSAEQVADAVQALAASAYRIEVREAPPAAWYQEPTDVDITSALTVTEQGRVFGAVAPLGTNHRAFAAAGRRREVPFGNVDYSKFMGGWGISDQGLVPAGPLTMDTGHAPMVRADHQVGPAHYDNSGSVVAAVAVGENRDRGIVWMAGALVPGVSVDKVARMLACRCSGDWQPHADRAGWVELIACLLVPSPGFAMAHADGMSATWDEHGALVASSVPIIGPGTLAYRGTLAHPDKGRFADAADAIAASIGVGRRDRLAEAVAAVEDAS